ncbi:MAG: M14 family zinc carboxypeptidase [Tepidisphaeraceae bacterium]
MLLTIPGTQLDIWHTYTQATNDLNTIQSAYPNLTRLISLGKTVQNRDIWAMEITDNPGTEEDEPEYLYNGPMHGDEPVGMANNLHFIQYLLENYNGATGDGPRVTNLVNNMDIWVIPDMNWDGYTNVSRYNAHGIDLNRNFPEWTTRSFSSSTKYFGDYGNMFDGPVPQTALLEPETVAVMNFLRSRSFVSSAVFHGGDLVTNYPWDTDNSVGATYATAPDDALFRDVSLVYSTPNTLMYNNNSFPFVHGTTNGDYWYPISGGEQDWANIYTGNMQVTIELGYTKYPNSSQLPGLWTANRESMLQFMEAANYGVRGVITNSVTGAPVFAKVTMIAPAPSPTPDSNHPSTFPVYSDADLGDYHRMLLPGTYTLKFEAPGYNTQTISNVVVSSKTMNPNSTVRLNVQMVPVLPNGVWTGGGDGINWTNASNWSNSVSPGPADDVVINVAANPTIIVNGTHSVRSVTSSEVLTITNSGDLVVAQASIFNAAVNINGGSLIGAGNATFNTALNWTAPGGSMSGTGTTFISATGTLNVSGTGKRTSTRPLSISGTATLSSEGDKVLVLSALSLSGSGTLDLNDNDMILDYSAASQLAAVQTLINSARNGGDWLGNGLTSTSARNHPSGVTTLGAMEASDYLDYWGAGTQFSGVNLNSTMVLVKYTYYGDTDFNGTINLDDYANIDGGYLLGKTGWLNGDFDGSGGNPDLDDFSLIDAAFLTQSGPPL